MKKFMYTLFVVIFILFFFLSFNFFWRGSYEANLGKTIKLIQNGNTIKILSSYGQFSPTTKISFVDYSIIDKEIYISLYIKFYSFPNSLESTNNIIKIPEKGVYKIYYRNPDKSLEYIKEIIYE